MNIVLMAQHFYPEEVSGAVLATELAVGLARLGHNVSFVTSAPNYPDGKVFDGYHNFPLHLSSHKGVRIIRTWSYISKGKSVTARALNYFTFSLGTFFGGLFFRRPDLILSYSPPLPLGLSASFWSKVWNVPWVLRVEDIFPEAAISAGVIRSKAAIRVFSALEAYLYRHADHISVLSDAFSRNLQQKGVPAGKISIIPVWADPEAITPMPRNNEFSEEHGLRDCFVLLYAGNHGYASLLEDVILAAELVRSEEDIRFVFVGDGVKKASLVKMAEDRKLRNVLFLPFQPRHFYSMVLATADLGLVTLNSESAHSSFPSKAFSVMASEKPMLVIAPKPSDLADMVSQSNCGVVVPPGNPSKIAEALLMLRGRREQLEAMGKKGRSHLIERYSTRHCVDRFEAMIKQVSSCS